VASLSVLIPAVIMGEPACDSLFMALTPSGWGFGHDLVDTCSLSTFSTDYVRGPCLKHFLWAHGEEAKRGFVSRRMRTSLTSFHGRDDKRARPPELGVEVRATRRRLLALISGCMGLADLDTFQGVVYRVDFKGEVRCFASAPSGTNLPMADPEIGGDYCSHVESNRRYEAKQGEHRGSRWRYVGAGRSETSGHQKMVFFCGPFRARPNRGKLRWRCAKDRRDQNSGTNLGQNDQQGPHREGVVRLAAQRARAREA